VGNSTRGTISHLQSDRKLKGECCYCDSTFSLADAVLFYVNQPPPPEAMDLISRRKTDITARRSRLKERRTRARETVERITVDVNMGKILEKVAPRLNGFSHSPRDCRPLFDPIDYVVFRGLNRTGRVEGIVFLDVKTGGAVLSRRQRDIQSAVTSGRVEWATYRV
jgi:predicted Holliday junction resolvase-like endonuclease